MDAGEMLILELHGTLTPGRVARITLERLQDQAWLQQSAQALGALYREHVGASARMAERLLSMQPA
jgi:hypothetical protein